MENETPQTRNWTTTTIVWMALSALAFGTFWHLWNLIAGEIPALREILLVAEMKNFEQVVIKPEWVLTLPLALSRSLDAFIAPSFALIFWQLMRVTHSRNETANQAELINGLIDDLIGGLISGLIFGLIGGLIFGLIGGLIFGLIGGLIIGLIVGLIIGLISGLAYSLTFGLIVGTFWLGLLPGLIISAMFTVPILILFAVGVLIKRLKKLDYSGLGKLVKD